MQPAPVTPCLRAATRSRRPSRPGFTFIEVLFAIIILGVGLIMIAGMIPVAIQQGQKSQEDLSGRIACDNGYAIVRAKLYEATASTDLQPTHSPPATVGGANTPVVPRMDYGPSSASATWFATFQSDRISANDPRFQWFPFYQREIGSGRVNVIILTGRRISTDIGLNGERYWPNFAFGIADNQPQEGTAIFVDGESPNCSARLSAAGINASVVAARTATTDYVIFTGFTNSDADDAPVDGAFVIIGEAPAGADASRNTGRIFRIGTQMSAGNKSVWTLDPAYDLAARSDGADQSLEDFGRASAIYVLGRGLRDPSSPSGPANPYVGAAQDVAVERYSFTIR
jgi:prepilin-type N-terminal cleavage/methylation domain-containing protein